MNERTAVCWAATWSWVGHLLGGLGRRLGAPPPERRGDYIEYHDNPIMNHLPAVAIVFGNVINYMPLRDPNMKWVRRYDDYDNTLPLVALREHEYQHVLQYRRWGLAFIPAYLVAELWARMVRLSGRRAVNWFEKMADDGCEPCVREKHENLDLLGQDLK